MAPNLFKLSLCIFLISLFLPLLTHARPFVPKAGKPSPFDFIRHIQGHHKGEKVTGLHELKKFLEQFGYLNYHHSPNQTHLNDDVFDDLLESAIKSYQLYYHLEPTGTLNDRTVAKMVKSRCGVPDMINGTRGRHLHEHGNFHAVSRYSFFDGSPRWPASKTHLSYGFPPGTNPDIVSAVARAFNQWATATHFTFSQAQDYNSADLTISFHRRDHGDGHPFDGPGGTVAHAWAPQDGRFHYDADEKWAVGAVQDAFDLETVALHEIGHLLGLDHSELEDAIMYAYIPSGMTKGLHGDDIQGIRALYNV